MNEKFYEVTHHLYENRVAYIVGATLTAVAVAGIAAGAHALAEAWGNGIAPDGPTVDLNSVHNS